MERQKVKEILLDSRAVVDLNEARAEHRNGQIKPEVEAGEQPQYQGPQTYRKTGDGRHHTEVKSIQDRANGKENTKGQFQDFFHIKTEGGTSERKRPGAEGHLENERGNDL